MGSVSIEDLQKAKFPGVAPLTQAFAAAICNFASEIRLLVDCFYVHM